MKITFYSNFMNHHQLELSKHLYNLTCGEYRFVACEPIDPMRLAMGYEDMNKKFDFIIRPYEDDEQNKEAERLASECDVMIFGSGDEKYFRQRMATDKLTIKYCERLLKKGLCRRFIPTTRKKIHNGYVKYKDKDFYVLCSSAYTSYDLSLCGFPADKCFKWGYFPKASTYDKDELMLSKDPNEIVWVGRFIDWKHPEMMIKLAEDLKKANRRFHITMIGNGSMYEKIQQTITKKKLGELVTLTDSIPANKVSEYMKRAGIFVTTSDFQEGWGAVVNEAMSCGCAVVGSHAVGSVPYLIDDAQNGLIYKRGSNNGLFKSVSAVLEDADFQYKLGYNAYKTISETWNAKKAAENLMKLIESNIDCDGLFGPCSRAEITKNNWYSGN